MYKQIFRDRRLAIMWGLLFLVSTALFVSEDGGVGKVHDTVAQIQAQKEQARALSEKPSEPHQIVIETEDEPDDEASDELSESDMNALEDAVENARNPLDDAVGDEASASDSDNESSGE